MSSWMTDAAVLKVKPLTTDWTDNGENTAEFKTLKVNLKTDHLTTSGYSSGGFMTNNVLAIFNKNLMGGAAIASGGPCATAHICKSEDKVVDYGTKGIEKMAVYIWGGKKDYLTGIELPKQSAAWYKNYTSAVEEEYSDDCGHSYPNALPPNEFNPRGDCANGGMINSNDDLAGRTLAHVMKETMKPWNLDYNKNGQLYLFDTSDYLVGDHRMYKEGYIYIPEHCLTNTCKSHVWWHGCGGTSGLDYIKSHVMRATGIVEHASANDFIAIFPQAWDPQDENKGWSQCWASDLTQEINHPQLQSWRKMLEGIFDKDVLMGDNEEEPMQFLQE